MNAVLAFDLVGPVAVGAHLRRAFGSRACRSLASHAAKGWTVASAVGVPALTRRGPAAPWRPALRRSVRNNGTYRTFGP